MIPVLTPSYGRSGNLNLTQNTNKTLQTTLCQSPWIAITGMIRLDKTVYG